MPDLGYHISGVSCQYVYGSQGLDNRLSTRHRGQVQEKYPESIKANKDLQVGRNHK